MGTSDIIARFILETLENAGGRAEMQRSVLADRFGCVPSQINYVLTTRFTPERGYMVESRRGEGGYIRITRVRPSPERIIMHTVNAVAGEVDRATAEALVQNVFDAGAADEAQAGLLRAAVSDRALRPVPPEIRDEVRASVLKHMLVSLISDSNI